MLSNSSLLMIFSGANAKMEKQCVDCACASGLRVGLSRKSMEIMQTRPHRARSSRIPFFIKNWSKRWPKGTHLELLGAAWCAHFDVISAPFAGPGPMICPGRIGHLVLRQKWPSRHPKSSNRTWNLGLQATLSRSTSLDPFKLGTFDKSFLFNPFTSLAQLRYVNFIFVRSTLLYDD